MLAGDALLLQGELGDDAGLLNGLAPRDVRALHLLLARDLARPRRLLGGDPIGGMFNRPAEVPVTFWLYYFNVDDIDAAVRRVEAGGGKVLNGPMEVPGGAWIIQGQDPQGAMFALVGPRA